MKVTARRITGSPRLSKPSGSDRLANEMILMCDHGVGASWIAPFTGLSPRQFGKLVTVLRRQGADAVRKGRPWSLQLGNRTLLVVAYWRTNLTMRQLAPLFGVSESAADRIIDHLGPMLALQPRKRFAKGTVLIADGTLVPTRDHTVAEPVTATPSRPKRSMVRS